MLVNRVPLVAAAPARRASVGGAVSWVPQRCSVACRSAPEGSDTLGVANLLARDRKQPKLQPELQDAVDRDSGAASGSGRSAVLKGRSQRRRDAAAAQRAAAASAVAQAGQEEPAGSSKATAPTQPKRCKDAIDAGLALFQAGEHQAAIDMWNRALELPGNGAYRLAGSPREYSCPSDAEENAALYNMACAYVALGQAAAALTCLEAVLENGFDQYGTMRADPDLRPLGRQLDDLVGRYDSPVAQAQKRVFGAVTGVFGRKGQPEQMVSSGDKKPWIMW